MNYRIHIKAGRLYQEPPYSHAGGDAAAFLEYAGEPDKNGIYTVSGLTWHPLNGGRSNARVGNVCASAVGLCWGLLGNSLSVHTNNGAIDGVSNYVTVLEQTSGLIENEQFYYNETLGANVYKTYIIDKKCTFTELFGQGYLPITMI